MAVSAPRPKKKTFALTNLTPQKRIMCVV